jgi:hypothetical protein
LLLEFVALVICGTDAKCVAEIPDSGSNSPLQLLDSAPFGNPASEGQPFLDEESFH